MSFADKLKQQEELAKKEGYASMGNDWLKFTEGDNKFRVLVEPETIYEDFTNGICYTDCGYEGSPKAMTYVLDRKDGKIKLAKLPYTIATTIANYESDEDYAFTGFPMDYDVKVTAKNAGTKEVKYTLTPSPRREIVPSEIMEQLKKRKPVTEIIAKMKENKKNEDIADGNFERRQEARKQAIQEAAEADASTVADPAYPTEDIDPDSIPF